MKHTIKSLHEIILQQEDAIIALSNHVQELQETIIAMKADQAKQPTTQRSSSPRGTTKATGRDYGPDSQREMTPYWAIRILRGKYAKWSVRKIADELGFSRGQVYSLRGEYTMKATWKLARRLDEHRKQHVERVAARIANRKAA